MNEQQNDQIKKQKPQGIAAGADDVTKKDIKAGEKTGDACSTKKGVKSDDDKLGGGSCGTCN